LLDVHYSTLEKLFMDTGVKEDFMSLWRRFFDDAELPIAFYYTDEEGHAEMAKPGSTPRCVIGALSLVRKGNALCFDAKSVGCFGGKRYLGFSEEIRPDFNYFLSCGIPGKVEGERYKKTPELVDQSVKLAPRFKAPGKFIVFKRWDSLEKNDEPEVVIFFATRDVISGLFTLAGYDEAEANVVFAPFGSGCSSILQYPYLEKSSPDQEP
jgi:uncharacterized protein (DUF169 family)